MRKSILLFTVTCISCFAYKNSHTQTPDWSWAKSSGGVKSEISNSVATDILGNSYVTGFFQSSTIIFGNDTLTNAYVGAYDIFLVKFDVNGNELWARSIGGIGSDAAYSIAVDSIGNVFIAGDFNSPTISFGSITLNNVGLMDIFLAKYDSNGNAQWAKNTGGTEDDFATSITIDTLCNVYIAGHFGSSTINFDTITFTNSGSFDLFITKYDSNGNLIWAKNAGGNNFDLAFSVAVDNSENVYLTGYFDSPEITFDSFTLTNFDTNGYDDIFLTKYDHNGNVLWAKRAGGISDDDALSVVIDYIGNVYLSGYFWSPTLEFGSSTLTNNGAPDIFLTKYDSEGNVLWTKSEGGTGIEETRSITEDAWGNIYLSGIYTSSTLAVGSNILPNMGGYDIFLVKYNSSGNVIWSKSVGGTGNDFATSITENVLGNFFMTGYFQSNNITFGSIVLTNDSVGTNDIFIAKLDISNGINVLNNSQNIIIFPNPFINNISIILSDKASIEISNINGQIIKSVTHDNGETSVDIGNLSSGVYIVRAMTDKEIITKKIIKE